MTPAAVSKDIDGTKETECTASAAPPTSRPPPSAAAARTWNSTCIDLASATAYEVSTPSDSHVTPPSTYVGRSAHSFQPSHGAHVDVDVRRYRRRQRHW